MSWTIKTLKKHIDQRFQMEKEARKLSRRLMDKRLDGMNEVREQLNRQIRTFVSVEKYDGEMRAIYTKLDDIVRRLNERAGSKMVWSILISILSLVGVSVVIIINILTK